jgi:hypothetical protein
MADPDIDDDQGEAEQLDATVTDAELDDDPVDLPRDRALGVTDYGTTPAEESVPESVARRAARETPDFDQTGHLHGDPGAVPGLARVDDDPEDGELLGEVEDDPALPSAEEAAMHVVDPPA